MRSAPFLAVAIALAVAAPVLHGRPQTPAQAATQFIAARLVAARPVEYPANSVGFGPVVLDVVVDDTGAVAGITPKREIASLTGAAMASVKKWEYKAATRDGVPVWSRATVVVMFNPQIPGAPKLPPISNVFQQTRAPYDPDPADVESVSWAQYPWGSMAVVDLSVTLEVNLSDSGAIENVVPIHNVPPLTSAAIAAVKTWKFLPAHYRGQAIAAPIAVAFVFRVPAP